MDERTPGSATRRRKRRTGGGVPRLPWRLLTNPFAPIEILSDDQLEAIHLASLRILAEVGFEVLGDRAVDLPPLLEALGLAELNHDPRNNRIWAL